MQIFSNNGATTLTIAVTALDTTITVVDASKFPVGEFKVTLETVDRSKNEIVLVTGVVGNVLTVVRAQEGTVATDFPVDAKVENRVTAEWLNALQTTVDGMVDDTEVVTTKAYSSSKVLELHNAQAEAIAHLSGASATFSSNVSQVVPEEPAAKADISWVNGQASSNASVFSLGANEVNFYVDGNYGFLTTITLYRLSDGSSTAVTFELYDADTGTVLKSVSQAVDMAAGTKETLPLNVLVPITGASEADPVRMKVRMQCTAMNGTLELFAFNGIVAVQSAALSGSIESIYIQWSKDTIYVTQSMTGTITNYDSKTSYTVSAVSGNISIVGDTITYTAPNTATTDVVTVNGRSIDIVVSPASVLAPTNTTPANNATGVGDSPTLVASAFATAGLSDTHTGSRFKLYSGGSLVHDSGVLGAVTQYTIPAGVMVVGTVYSWEVAYQGATLGWSSYSTQTTFTAASSFIDISGVQWNPTTDTYVRTGDGTTNNAHIVIASQMKRCVLQANGTVAYYLDPNDSTKKADGTAADLSGATGNVMVEIPKFYMKYEWTGTAHHWSIADKPTAGYIVHPAFIKGGVEVNYRYMSAYNARDNGTKLISASGVYPTTNLTRAAFRTKAAANGAGWSQWEWNTYFATQILYLVEYANFNVEMAIGKGRTYMTGGSWADGSYYALSGLSNNQGNKTANVWVSGTAYANNYMSYRGIEHWYGHLWKFLDGVNVQNHNYYVNNKPSTFADDVFTGDYVLKGTAVATSGYISNYQQDGDGLFPSAITGSGTTYVGDYYYQGTGNFVVMVGGDAISGDSAGAFCLLSAGAASHASVAISAGLSF